MKQLIFIAIVIMAGLVYAGDPNSMPNPTAQNRITVTVQGNIATFKMYIPDENQQILTNDSGFPSLIEKLLFRYIDSWVAKLLDNYNSDMNLLEAKEARTK